MDFLECGLLKLMLNNLKVVWCIKNNHKYNQEYGKLKKEFLHRCISKMFVDTEQFSKIQILRSYFSRILLINSELPAYEFF